MRFCSWQRFTRLIAIEKSLFVCLALAGCGDGDQPGQWKKVADWRAGFDGEMFVSEDRIHLLDGYVQDSQYTAYALPDDAGSGRAVEFVTPTVGYLGRLNGPYGLLKTVDAKTFEPIAALKGAKICGIAHVGERLVVAVGPYYGGDETQKKRISISRDGGSSWDHPDVNGLISGATDVECLSENRCVVAGKNSRNKGALFLTVDGGRTWRQVHEDDVGYGWKLQFLDELNGFASMWPNAIAKTEDGGITWQRIEVSATTNIEGIGFFNRSLGFISGDETLVTQDGGKTWRKTSLSGKVDKFFLANGVMYAKAGQIMRYEIGTNSDDDEGGISSEFPKSRIRHRVDRKELVVSMQLIEPSPARFLFVDEAGSSIHMEELPVFSGYREHVPSRIDSTKHILVLTDPELYLIEL